MPGTSDIFLAVGGVFLVTWYGISRMAGNRSVRRHPALPGSSEYRQSAQMAIAAEFAGEPRLVETIPGGSVFCPDCRVEYPAGTLYCECGSETAELEDIEPNTTEDEELSITFAGEQLTEPKDQDLVCVYIAENTWKASLITSILESHDVPCATTGNAPPAIYNFSYSPLSEVRILVPASFAQIARTLLEEYHSSNVD